jgi:DNA-binding response OmpR family regulator
VVGILGTSPEEAPQQGGVLVIEDDALVARAWRRALARRGFEVAVARSVAAARTVIAQWERRPFHYVIVDDRLPDGFGAELIGCLNALAQRPAVALVTAHASTERWIAAARNGWAMAPKPQTPAELFALLEFLALPPALLVATRPWGDASAAEQNADALGGGRRPRRAEERVLRYLVERSGAPVSAAELALALFKRTDLRGLELVRAHVANLRKALGAARAIIETVPGLGYRARPQGSGRYPSQFESS